MEAGLLHWLALKPKLFSCLLKPAGGCVVEHAGKSDAWICIAQMFKAMSSMGNTGQQFVQASLEKTTQV